MSNHTPGPWKVGNDEAFVYALNSAGTNRIFFRVQQGWITEGSRNTADDKRTSQKELMASARLAAAAPELLEALKAMEGTFDPTLFRKTSPAAVAYSKAQALIKRLEAK